LIFERVNWKILRKVFLSLAALIFALGILASSVMRTTAQTKLDFKVTPAVATPTPTEIDYHFPYPGILPDHFLYPIKMLRDKIWLFLTTDPVKKSERLLLFADKRIGAGRALIEGGKLELGITTLTKAEKYLEQAIVQAQKAKETRKDTAHLYERLSQSALKHEEVLKVILEFTPDKRSAIEQMIESARNVYQTVMPTDKESEKGVEEAEEASN